MSKDGEDFTVYNFILFEFLLTLFPGVDGSRRRPHTSLYEMIDSVRFMYICDLADVGRPLTF